MPLSAFDCEQIRTLVAEYAFSLDLGDADDFLGCFTSDARLAFVGLPDGHPLGRTFEGHAALRQFHELFRGATEGRLRHIAANISIAGEGDTASMRSYLLTVTAGATATNGATGIYRDELKRVDDGWRFSRREVTVDP